MYRRCVGGVVLLDLFSACPFHVLCSRKFFFFFPITLARWKADPVGESVSLFPLDRLFFFFFWLLLLF